MFGEIVAMFSGGESALQFLSYVCGDRASVIMFFVELYRDVSRSYFKN